MKRNERVITGYASVCWHTDDIKERRPNWSVKQCAAFLEKIERQLEDDMVQRGWDTIDTLLAMEPVAGNKKPR